MSQKSGLDVLGTPDEFYENLFNLKKIINSPIPKGSRLKVDFGDFWTFDGETLSDGYVRFELKTNSLHLSKEEYDDLDEIYAFFDERIAMYEVITRRTIFKYFLCRDLDNLDESYHIISKESYPSFVYPDSDLVLMTRRTADPIKYIEIFDCDGDFVLAREFTVTKRGKVKDKLGKVLKSGYHIGSFIGDTVELVRTSFDPSEPGDYFKTVHISELDEIFNQD